ncbi:MAG: ribulose-phosphate 3-epimerase [Candidatus Woesearchaeota archaeon]
MRQKILPSLMPKSQKELNQDFKKLKGIAKILHLDVADGKFVPNKTFQFPFRLSKEFQYNAHLMVKNPELWIKKNLRKIDIFIPQIEEIKDVHNYVSWMKSNKKKIAFALKPETKVSLIKPYLNKIDYVLILTVHPGFYGAKFLKAPLRKIKQIKTINPKIKIIVDGGMHPSTINLAAQAGADLFVSGSYTTKSDNPKRAIKSLLAAIKN